MKAVLIAAIALAIFGLAFAECTASGATQCTNLYLDCINGKSGNAVCPCFGQYFQCMNSVDCTLNQEYTDSCLSKSYKSIFWIKLPSNQFQLSALSLIALVAPVRVFTLLFCIRLPFNQFPAVGPRPPYCSDAGSIAGSFLVVAVAAAALL